MDLVLPQIGSFRPVEGRPAPVPKEEVLSLTIKPGEFKGPLPRGETSVQPAGHDAPKHPRRFQALTSPVTAKQAPPVEEKAETLTELDVPKHPRRFQALAAAGPAKVSNRFSRRERAAEPAAASSSPSPSATPDVPAETQPFGPQIQLPTAVLAALAKAETAFVNAAPLSHPTVEGTGRKSRELRGVPPTFQERGNGRTIYDW